MRELFPSFDTIDHVDDHLRASLPADHPRRWVIISMIATVDGATALNGRSGGLGGPADKLLFHAVRDLADVILVGAGTARAERYHPLNNTRQRLAIVTASGDVDPKLTEHPATWLIAPRSSTVDAVRVIRAGQQQVDVAAALDQLDGVIVCEGGPSLNGQLLAHNLVDEILVTISPQLAGGNSARLAHGPDSDRDSWTLVHVWQDGNFLLLRYRRPDAELMNDPSGPGSSVGSNNAT